MNINTQRLSILLLVDTWAISSLGYCKYICYKHFFILLFIDIYFYLFWANFQEQNSYGIQQVYAQFYRMLTNIFERDLTSKSVLLLVCYRASTWALQEKWNFYKQKIYGNIFQIKMFPFKKTLLPKTCPWESEFY